MAALDALEAAHLRVLEVLDQPHPEHPAEPSWTVERIADLTPGLSTIGRQAAIGGLMRHGMTATTAGYGICYCITEFGHAMLGVMRLALPDEAPSQPQI